MTRNEFKELLEKERDLYAAMRVACQYEEEEDDGEYFPALDFIERQLASLQGCGFRIVRSDTLNIVLETTKRLLKVLHPSNDDVDKCDIGGVMLEVQRALTKLDQEG